MALPLTVEDVEPWLRDTLKVDKVAQTGIVWETAIKVLVEVTHPDGRAWPPRTRRCGQPRTSPTRFSGSHPQV